MKTVSIVIPIYNEETLIEAFYQRLVAAIDPLPYLFELIYVNDGSSDETAARLESLLQQDARISILSLSRNFGHQAAICAGLEHASGEYVITLDGDGQHPPELIAEMIGLAENGYDVVLTQRKKDLNEGWFKRATSNLFYRLINHLSDTETLPGGADFRLLTRQVLENLLAMPEYHRFLRGMISWMGFRSVILPFVPEKRIAGKSKYSLKKMFRLASDAVFSFSLVPLYIGLSAGAVFLLLALVEVIYVLSFWLTGRSSLLEPGWSSLMFMLLIIAGLLMIILGFIGVYVGYIFQEVKRRPVFIIRNQTSSDQSDLSKNEGDES